MAKPRPLLGNKKTLPETADRLRMSPDRLRDYAKAGLIRCYRIGPRGWIYFDDADVDAFVESMRVTAGTRPESGAA
jgi:hypothetical protein